MSFLNSNSILLRRRGELIALLLWVAAFMLSCNIGLYSMPAGRSAPPSVFDSLFGSARLALSWNMITRADIYFHRGSYGRDDSIYHNQHPFETLAEKITPAEHAHLEGGAVGEIMPWLWLAVRSDPHNTDGWLIAAFWIAEDLGRPDIAFQLLAEARSYNQEAYELYMEEGRLALNYGQLQHARRMLDRGLALLRPAEDETDSNLLMDRAKLLQLRALLHDVENQPAQAITLFEQVLAIFPEQAALHERISELRSSGHTIRGADLARVLREMNLAPRQMGRFHDCDEHEDDQHDHHD